MNKKLMIPVLMAVIAGSSLFASASFAAAGDANFDRVALSCPGNAQQLTGNDLEAGCWGHGGHHGDGHGC